MSDRPNRPVDMSDDFKENGWEYCKYLITDPRSDAYLKAVKEKKNESTELDPSFEEGSETKT